MTIGADDDRRRVASDNATKTQSDGGPTPNRGPAWTGLRVAVPVYVHRTTPKPGVAQPSRGAETTRDPDEPIEPGVEASAGPGSPGPAAASTRSEEHTSELHSPTTFRWPPLP